MVNRENIIKKLLYRSIHRGCKETDFLIGNFASDNLDKMSEEQLVLFDDFLQEDDLKIYDWILGKEIEPVIYSEIIKQIRAFHSF